MSFSLAQSQSVPRGLTVVSYEHAGSPAALAYQDGHDLILHKRPGRTHYMVSGPGGGQLTGADQLISPAGSWVRASFAGGVRAGKDGEPMLAPIDRETVIGWLSSTGPFIPLPPSSADGSNGGTADGPGALIRASGSGDNPKMLPVRIEQLRDAEGVPSELQISELELADGAVSEANKRAVALDLSNVEPSNRKGVKFKAGAELSGKVNIAPPSGGEDDNCNGSTECPAPSKVLLAFQADTGAISTGVLDLESTDPVVVEPSGLRQALADALGLDGPDALKDVDTSLWVGDLGGGPLAILRGTLTSADGKTTDAMVAIDRKGNLSKRVVDLGPTSYLQFADVLGEGYDQLVECRQADGDAKAVTCRVSHLSPGDGLSDLGGDNWSDASTIAGSRIIMADDLDGDGCADLLTDAGELVSSRCDGQFEAHGVELGGWTTQLAYSNHNTTRSNRATVAPGGNDGSSGGTRATDYNSSRSNTTSSIVTPDDTGGEVGGVFFFDAVEFPRW